METILLPCWISFRKAENNKSVLVWVNGSTEQMVTQATDTYICIDGINEFKLKINIL